MKICTKAVECRSKIWIVIGSNIKIHFSMSFFFCSIFSETKPVYLISFKVDQGTKVNAHPTDQTNNFQLPFSKNKPSRTLFRSKKFFSINYKKKNTHDKILFPGAIQFLLRIPCKKTQQQQQWSRENRQPNAKKSQSRCVSMHK